MNKVNSLQKTPICEYSITTENIVDFIWVSQTVMHFFYFVIVQVCVENCTICDTALLKHIWE